MSFKIIVTLGPAVLTADKLIKIDSLGDCIYRINGAHVEVEEAPILADQVRQSLPNAKIMLDLPGNKIRTANLSEPIRLNKGESFELYDHQINFPGFFSLLKKGDIILANDSTYTLEVVQASKQRVTLLSHSEGMLVSNKGLHIQGVHENLPFLFEKDEALINAACKADLSYISLSYVRSADDIREVKRILSKKGKNIQIISKIETMSAVRNLSGILDEVGSVNVDRGDLSADIGIMRLPMAQAYVVKSALAAQKEIFLATQILNNMENYPVPALAEIIDLHRYIELGISGVQLSAETAIGKYPLECVKLIFDLYQHSYRYKNKEFIIVEEA